MSNPQVNFMDTTFVNPHLVESHLSLFAAFFASVFVLLLSRHLSRRRRQKKHDARSQLLHRLRKNHEMHIVGKWSALESIQIAMSGSPVAMHDSSDASHLGAATRHLLLRAASRLTELARAGSKHLRRRKFFSSDSTYQDFRSRRLPPADDGATCTKLMLFDEWPNSMPSVVEKGSLSPTDVKIPYLRSEGHCSAPMLSKPSD